MQTRTTLARYLILSRDAFSDIIYLITPYTSAERHNERITREI